MKATMSVLAFVVSADSAPSFYNTELIAAGPPIVIKVKTPLNPQKTSITARASQNDGTTRLVSVVPGVVDSTGSLYSIYITDNAGTPATADHLEVLFSRLPL